MFALPIFPGSRPPSIVSVHELNFCVRDGERGERRLWRMQRPERVAAVGERRWRSRQGAHRAPQQETGGHVQLFQNKKSSTLSNGASVFALPIFPGSRPPSIVSVHELNFCVRDGNRWTLMTINTNFYGWLLTIVYIKALRLRLLGDPYRIRTDVNGVRGRCLNHLTNGPLVHLHGLEPGTH